eukprot:CAMPEP_0179143128 /NCGR_PEP_ID=MMETSP0796-20121207/68821_1 /TAXON_ID=73915 /ORGANISM="Pyrodinium bahamense, Strain pbaha01" /LENGTH=37 /DNA_ID= /DNA_START= /DNA_END= /DNA_ORIENTATION=
MPGNASGTSEDIRPGGAGPGKSSAPGDVVPSLTEKGR